MYQVIHLGNILTSAVLFFEIQELILQGSSAAQKLLILIVGACVFRFVQNCLSGCVCMRAYFGFSLQESTKAKHEIVMDVQSDAYSYEMYVIGSVHKFLEFAQYEATSGISTFYWLGGQQKRKIQLLIYVEKLT